MSGLDIVIAVCTQGSWKEATALISVLKCANLKVLALPCRTSADINASSQDSPSPSSSSIPGYRLQRVYPLLGASLAVDAAAGQAGWHAQCIHQESGAQLFLLANNLIILGSEKQHVGENKKRRGTENSLLALDFAVCGKGESSCERKRSGGLMTSSRRSLSWIKTVCKGLLPRRISKELCHQTMDTDESYLCFRRGGSSEDNAYSPSSLRPTMLGKCEKVLSPDSLLGLLETCDGRPLVDCPISLQRGMVPVGVCNLLVPQSIVSTKSGHQDTALDRVKECLRAIWMTLFLLGKIRPACPEAQQPKGQPASPFPGSLQYLSSQGEPISTCQYVGLMIQEIELAHSQEVRSSAPCVFGAFEGPSEGIYVSWVFTLMQQLGACQESISKVYKHAASIRVSMSSFPSHTSVSKIIAAAVSAVQASSSHGHSEVMKQPLPGKSGLRRSKTSYGILTSLSNEEEAAFCAYSQFIGKAPSSTARIKYVSLQSMDKKSNGGLSMFSSFPSAPGTPQNRSHDNAQMELHTCRTISEDSSTHNL